MNATDEWLMPVVNALIKEADRSGKSSSGFHNKQVARRIGDLVFFTSTATHHGVIYDMRVEEDTTRPGVWNLFLERRTEDDMSHP